MEHSDAIVVRDLTRAFMRTPRLRDVLFSEVAPADAWWAIRGVSFAMRPGESLAVLGVNGAGKSTLLRILAGALSPSSGTVRVNGRVGRLLSLGAGLIEDLTGEENARVALALVGEQDAVAEVARFAELGDAMGRRIRGYSSGMRLRLAYALAVGTRADVLIADEVLGVGDEPFQQKCAHFVAEFLRRGGTLVFATHNLYLAEKLCTRALWLDAGRVIADGPCHELARDYRAAVLGANDASTVSVVEEAATLECSPGGELAVDLRPYCGLEDMELQIVTMAGVCVTAQRVPCGARLASAPNSLLPGHYRVRLVRGERGTRESVVQWRLVCRGRRRELGSVLLPHRWRVRAERHISPQG